jgi:hypothetical protein
VAEKERIDPRGVKRLNERLKSDQGLRGKAKGHAKRDFYDFMESNFDLAPDQREELRSIPPPVEEALGAAIAAILEYNGDVEYAVQAGSPAISYEVNGKVGADGKWEVGGKVTLAKLPPP